MDAISEEMHRRLADTPNLTSGDRERAERLIAESEEKRRADMRSWCPTEGSYQKAVRSISVTVKRAPPLSEEQKDVLRLLLGPDTEIPLVRPPQKAAAPKEAPPEPADNAPVANRPAAPAQLVYFVERDGFIKIGSSVQVAARLRQISSGSAMIEGMTVGPATLLATMPGANGEERALHKRFAHLRFAGEWFLPDDELRELIASLAAASSIPGHEL